MHFLGVAPTAETCSQLHHLPSSALLVTIPGEQGQVGVLPVNECLLFWHCKVDGDGPVLGVKVIDDRVGRQADVIHRWEGEQLRGEAGYALLNCVRIQLAYSGTFQVLRAVNECQRV